MCLALDYANEINQKIKEIKEKYKELEDKEKLYNAKQLDALHEFENLGEKFDLYIGWKIAKKMNTIRIERRKIKNEKEVMDLLIKQVSEIHIQIGKLEKTDNILQHNSENKVYQLRVEILNKKNDFKKQKEKNETQNLKEYYSNQKLPKTKGSSIRVKYTSIGEKSHIMDILSRNYIEARLNAEGKYVDLIERK